MLKFARRIHARLTKNRVAPADFGALTRTSVAESDRYALEIINDDRTPMSFVVNALVSCAGLTKREAVDLMLRVHTAGSAVVGRADRETVQKLSMHIQCEAEARGYPLRCQPRAL